MRASAKRILYLCLDFVQFLYEILCVKLIQNDFIAFEFAFDANIDFIDVGSIRLLLI